MITLILGSASPRRKEILSRFKIPFQIVASNFDENSHLFTGDPQKYVTELSQGKSWTIPHTDPETFILTADTVVYKEEKVYNKAKDRDDARRILSELSGGQHTVFTGVSLRKGTRIETLTDRTDVEFDTLTPREMEIYLDKVHWQDKAGAYGIQDGGALLVKELHGCYDNVIGLPLSILKKLFLEFDVDLWDYI